MKKILPLFLVLVFLLSACGQDKPAPVELDESTSIEKERVTDIDGMTQVLIPEGRFMMGGVAEGYQENERPEHKVTVSDFWLDKVEVTNAMYTLCVDAGACEVPHKTSSATHDPYFYAAEFADYPVIHVTWNDANAYCTWAGKRLPTEAEWEHAARGDEDYRNFPWGDESPTGTHANFNNAVRDAVRVGSFPAGASPYGVLDMAGNVWEWVADYYSAKYYAESSDTNPMGPSQPVGDSFLRVIRGGSYADVAGDIRVSKRGFESGSDPEALDHSSALYLGESSSKIGFRCAADK